MNQEKTEKFIAECRKYKKMTQKELAKKCRNMLQLICRKELA